MTYLTPPAVHLNDAALLDWARQRGLLDTGSTIYSPQDLMFAANCWAVFGPVCLDTVEALPTMPATQEGSQS